VNKQLRQYAGRFDAQSLRERALIGVTLIVVVLFLWWSYFASPVMAKTDNRLEENQRLASEIDNTRTVVHSIRQRMRRRPYS